VSDEQPEEIGREALHAVLREVGGQTGTGPADSLDSQRDSLDSQRALRQPNWHAAATAVRVSVERRLEERPAGPGLRSRSGAGKAELHDGRAARQVDAALLACFEHRLVHSAMIYALSRRLPVPDRLAAPVAVQLIQVAGALADSGDPHNVVDDALDGALIPAWQLEPRYQEAVRRLAARIALRLPPYELQRFVRWHERELREYKEFADALLLVLGSREIIDNFNSNDEELRVSLRGLTPATLAQRIPAIRNAALLNVPSRVGPALDFVEVLQSAGLWQEAVDLASEIERAIPDTPERAVPKAYTQAAYEAARHEAAVNSGDLPSAKEALARWRSAQEERARLERERETDPLDFI
jgi:hypothetical protein